MGSVLDPQVDNRIAPFYPGGSPACETNCSNLSDNDCIVEKAVSNKKQDLGVVFPNNFLKPQMLAGQLTSYVHILHISQIRSGLLPKKAQPIMIKKLLLSAGMLGIYKNWVYVYRDLKVF